MLPRQKRGDERQNNGSRSRDKHDCKSHTRLLMPANGDVRGKKPESEEEMDMFADSVGSVGEGSQNGNKIDGKQLPSHNLTDSSGYYNPIIGAMIGDQVRYRILEKLGQGVFGTVLKCERVSRECERVSRECEKTEEEHVAVKMLRKSKATQKSGEREYKILKQIEQTARTLGKQTNVMKVYDHFTQNGHLCLVCELLGENLRSFTHRRQPTLHDIRLYAISMMRMSNELRNCKIIHADLKPDNFMFRDTKVLDEMMAIRTTYKVRHTGGSSNAFEDLPEQNTSLTRLEQKAIINNLKLVDFGTSYEPNEHSTDNEYMVARYYRAPEIILGTQVKPSQMYAIDVWAIGCSLFELYTNKFLFNGNSNNQMLKLMMGTKGKFSMKMLNKSVHKEKHFDSDYNFLYTYVDDFTKRVAVKKMQGNITPEREMMNLLRQSNQHQDPKLLHSFRDFLEKCLTLNPKDRITPQKAMEHSFLHYQIKLEH